MKRIISVIVTAAIMAGMSIPVLAESEEESYWLCNVCEDLGGSPDCDCYILGDVNGDGYVDYLDALEISRFLVRMDNMITKNNLSYKAACICATSKPSINDFLEILRFMHCVNSEIPFDGNNTMRLPVATIDYSKPRDYPVRVEIDIDKELVSFILTEDFEGDIVLFYKIFCSPEITFYKYKPSGNSKLPFGSEILAEQYALDSDSITYYSVMNIKRISDTEKASAGTMIMTHKFDGVTPENVHSIKFSDVTSVEPFGKEYRINTVKSPMKVTVKGCEAEGCVSCGNPARAVGDVDGNGVITIGDAIEILRYLAKVDSVIDDNDFAFKAACVSGGDSPSINDVLEIMIYLAKV